LARSSKTQEFPDCPVVATEYPNLTRDYFNRKGKTVSIIKIKGAGEAYPHLPGVHYAVDISTSGKSVISNDLEIIDELMQTDACLIETKRTHPPARIRTFADLRHIVQEDFNDKELP